MALVTGLIYTFSVAVMPNLAGADDRTFVATMQRFNENPVFQLTFTGALVLTVPRPCCSDATAPGSPCAGPSPPSCSTASSSPLSSASTSAQQRDRPAGDPDRIADLVHVRNESEGRGGRQHRAHLFAIAAVAASPGPSSCTGTQHSRPDGMQNCRGAIMSAVAMPAGPLIPIRLSRWRCG